MESEKVKEIKKALENCQKNNCLDCSYFIDEKRCKANDLLLDTINLIDELDSENEKLLEAIESLNGSWKMQLKKIAELESESRTFLESKTMWKRLHTEVCEENQQLKDQIAKLEKDNELLRNAKVIYETVDYCYEDLKKTEKRIAELEKEIKENAFYAKGYAQGIKNTYEVVIPDKLKQFAERLKEQVKAKVDYYNDEVFDYSYNGISEKEIDETLKELRLEQ